MKPYPLRKYLESLTLLQWRLLQTALIAIAGAAVYLNSLRVPFYMDDRAIFLIGPQNPLDTLLHGGARRIVDFTFTLNHRIHDLQETGYHLVNLAIHLSASIVLYFLVISALAALRSSFTPKNSGAAEMGFVERFVPFFAAMLFVLHPLQTQAVTYVIQRYASLATLFYLLSALLYLRARCAAEENGAADRRSWLQGGSCLVAGILAINCKQIAATLPLMLILLEIFLFRGRLLTRRFYIVCGSVLVMVAGLGLIIWHDRSLPDLLFELRRATLEDLFISRTSYFLTQLRVVVTYLRMLCLPYGQSLIHDYPIYTTLSAVPVIVSLALHILLISAALVMFGSSRRKLLSDDWSRGALQRLAALGVVWFYVALTVESSIIPIRDVIFEHRVYLPSAGIFMTMAAVAALAAHGRKAGYRAAWCLAAVVCIILGGLTIARNHVWNDKLRLWQDTVSKSPNKALALTNLGGEYLLRQMPDKALPLFVRAVELNGDFQELIMGQEFLVSKALQGLNVDESRFTTGEEFRRPARGGDKGKVARENLPRFEALKNNNLGLAYEYLGNLDQARKAYSFAVRVNPEYDLAWFNLGLLDLRLGDRQQAGLALDRLKRLNSPLADKLASAMSR